MGRNGYLDKRRQMIQAATRQTSREAVDLTIWLAVVALNNEFGFGGQRAQRFIDELQRVAEEHEAECTADYDQAKEHLRARLEKILQCSVQRVD